MKRVNLANNFDLSLSNSFNALVGGEMERSLFSNYNSLLPRFNSFLTIKSRRGSRKLSMTSGLRQRRREGAGHPSDIRGLFFGGGGVVSIAFF